MDLLGAPHGFKPSDGVATDDLGLQGTVSRSPVLGELTAVIVRAETSIGDLRDQTGRTIPDRGRVIAAISKSVNPFRVQ